MNKRPPFATSDFEDDLDEIEGLENLGNTRKMSEEIELQIQEFDGNSLVPEFTLPDSNSSGERALLNFIFKEVTPDKAGSGPFAASLLMATLKSALNQHGIDRYLKLVGNIADLIADYSTKFTNEVKDALEIDNKSIENKSMNSNYDDTSTTSMGTSLQLAQTALPLINKILHFSAFTSDFCQQCKCYLPKLVLSQDDVLLLELQEAHDDLLPLFNNLLQELLISTVVRLIPILQISVGEMFNMNGREVGAPRKNSNTLSRLFVSMHRIGQSAQIHEKFQRHIMASLLSNFQLTVFEMVLLNPSHATNETGLLIEEKLEKLIHWFATNTTYEPTIKRYSILAQGLSSALLDETCESIACFTKDEFLALRSSQKGRPLPAETVQKLVDARRNYLERAVKSMPSLGQKELPQLDIVKTFSKNKVKRKVRTLKSFAERSYSQLSTFKKTKSFRNQL
jgi:hypothetical protein